MLDIMYELPSSENKTEFVEISADFVDSRLSLSDLLGTAKEVA
jgi:hypothetical protein